MISLGEAKKATNEAQCAFVHYFMTEHTVPNFSSFGYDMTELELLSGIVGSQSAYQELVGADSPEGIAAGESILMIEENIRSTQDSMLSALKENGYGEQYMEELKHLLGKWLEAVRQEQGISYRLDPRLEEYGLREKI